MSLRTKTGLSTPTSDLNLEIASATVGRWPVITVALFHETQGAVRFNSVRAGEFWSTEMKRWLAQPDGRALATGAVTWERADTNAVKLSYCGLRFTLTDASVDRLGRAL